MSSDLQTFYRNALPARIAALRSACAAFNSGDAGAEAVVRQIAHTLRGSGGTYGFPHISAAAAALEQATPEALPQRVDELIAVLNSEVNAS
jgi:HPt (histidine-containing phosphotransfer) domain-containing protein